jgi:HIV Tat-specific factor 1
MSNFVPPVNGGVVRQPFPHTPDAFESDPRVSYSTLDRKWILEDDVDGSEWEWEDELGKWVPSLDETLAEQQARAYAVPGVQENEDQAEQKKRKKDEDVSAAITTTCFYVFSEHGRWTDVWRD